MSLGETNRSAVYVVEVDSSNMKLYFPIIKDAIRTADFIALDKEFSGLGVRKKFSHKEFSHRYFVAKQVVKERGVYAIGISCFKQIEDDEDAIGKLSKELNPSIRHRTKEEESSCFPFFCVTFNITIFLQDLHVCDPEAALFLSRHHFSVQYAAERGVPYKKFRFDENFLDEENLPALLVHEIMKARKKLLVHNGLWDLLFLYEHFYGPLPSGQQLSSFVADISDMFSGGIIDTKVVAGTEWDEMNLTFLGEHF